MIKSKIDPASMSKQDIEAVVEYYFGIHPRYFIFADGLNLTVNEHVALAEGYHFPGFKPVIDSLNKMYGD